MSKPHRRKRHTAEQIIAKLREADAMKAAGKTVAQIVQALEVTQPTYHRWRKEYDGMKSSKGKRLKTLEQENARLKKLLAEAELDKAILKEVAEGKW